MIAFDIGLTLLILAGLALLAWWGTRISAERRRQAVRTQPFQDAWREILRRRMPLYATMPPDLQVRLERQTLDFLSRVELIGCDGLEITPEMRIVIAGHAALLALKHGSSIYSALRTVLVYPTEFVAPIHEEDAAGVVTEGEDVLSGQAIDTEQIVLSWQDIVAPPPGVGAWNLALHEFAHYIDETFDGALSARPAARGGASTWHDVFEAEFERLQSTPAEADETVIDPYGAEDPAEFFATATEAFFERASDMRARHLELYGLLAEFYGVDPASWQAPRTAPH